MHKNSDILSKQECIPFSKKVETQWELSMVTNSANDYVNYSYIPQRRQWLSPKKLESTISIDVLVLEAITEHAQC